MKLLEGKTALITGAARGIGKALALRFAQEGANIAFTDLVIDENGKATEAEIAACGVKCKGYASNAADFAQTEEVVKEVVADFGRIDILVNNAGITKDGLMMRMTESQWDAVIAVNLKSAFNFIHAVLPIMMRQRGRTRQCGTGQLCCLKGRPHSLGQEYRTGSRLTRHPRQRYRPRLYRNSHDGRPTRQCARRVGKENTPAPWRQGRRHRRCCNIPCL